MAIGKEPTRGHMQGTGKFFNASIYYHLFTGRQHGDDNRSPWQSQIEARLEELSMMIRRTPDFLDLDNYSFVDQQVKLNAKNDIRVGQCVAGDGGEEPDPRKSESDRKKKNKKRKKFSEKNDTKDMVKQVKVPQQPGSSECGYYVMCFIKDIMEDIIVLQNNFYGKEKYNQDEIDVVRNEWDMRVTQVIEDATAEKFVHRA